MFKEFQFVNTYKLVDKKRWKMTKISLENMKKKSKNERKWLKKAQKMEKSLK